MLTLSLSYLCISKPKVKEIPTYAPSKLNT